MPGKPDATRGRIDEPHDGEGQRRLATTRFPHQPQALARLDGQTDAVHRLQLAMLAKAHAHREMHGQIIDRK